MTKAVSPEGVVATVGGGGGGGGGGSGPQQQAINGVPPGPPLPILSSWQSSLAGGLPATFSLQGSPPPAPWQALPSTDLQMLALYNVPYMATHAKLNPNGALSGGQFDLLHAEGLSGFTGEEEGSGGWGWGVMRAGCYGPNIVCPANEAGPP